MQQLMLHHESIGYNVIDEKKGVVAKKRGDVVYLMQCRAVTVDLGVPKFCTHELPVTYNGSDYFLLPDSHVLAKKANKVACSRILPILNKVDGIWYENDGKRLKISRGPFRLKVSKTRRKPPEFHDFAVKKFDKNGLYGAE